MANMAVRKLLIVKQLILNMCSNKIYMRILSYLHFVETEALLTSRNSSVVLCELVCKLEEVKTVLLVSALLPVIMFVG